MMVEVELREGIFWEELWLREGTMTAAGAGPAMTPSTLFGPMAIAPLVPLQKDHRTRPRW